MGRQTTLDLQSYISIPDGVWDTLPDGAYGWGFWWKGGAVATTSPFDMYWLFQAGQAGVAHSTYANIQRVFNPDGAVWRLSDSTGNGIAQQTIVDGLLTTWPTPWHHWFFRRTPDVGGNNGSLQVWLDGVQRNSFAYSHLTNSGGLNFTEPFILLNNRTLDAEPSVQAIEQFAIWNREVTDAEIVAMAATAKPSHYPTGRILYMRLESDDSEEGAQFTATSANMTTVTGPAGLTDPVDKPTLTNPTAINVGENSVGGRVTTDKASGTMFAAAVPDGDAPSSAQIIAGLQSDGSTAALATGNITVSSAGNVTISALTGNLSHSTPHELAFAHDYPAGDEDSDPATVGFATTTPDTTAPVLTSGTASPLGDTTVTLGATTDEGNGEAFYVVVADGATAPTDDQVIAGVNYGNVTVVAAGGNLTISGTGAFQFPQTGNLAQSTAYDAHVVHRDAATTPNKSNVLKIDFTTIATDAAAPVLSNGNATVSTTGATLQIDTDEPAQLYVVLLADGATAPNKAEVQAGTGAAGATPIAAFNEAEGSAGTHVFAGISGLSAETPYDAYVVGLDGSGNDSDPTLIEFTTLAVSAGTITTRPVTNNAGTVLANETGIIVDVYNSSTGALVVRKTGETSDGSGVVVVTDALIVPSTVYKVTVEFSGSRFGMETRTAT